MKDYCREKEKIDPVENHTTSLGLHPPQVGPLRRDTEHTVEGPPRLPEGPGVRNGRGGP